MNGRHPLLLAGDEPVVPFDLELIAAERTLLISGPNTGGKTVLLKAVGLAAALAQSGIVPPVGPGSRLPVFRRFYADIGDRQSIAASLSTFSAHVRHAAPGAGRGGRRRRWCCWTRSGSGTDPAEGAALAAATLRVAHRGGARSRSPPPTSGALKDLASHTPGVVNASLQFDAATLTPTYRFLKGVPGRSYGLAIARRLGVAPEILADAEARVPDGRAEPRRAAGGGRGAGARAAGRAGSELRSATVELDALGRPARPRSRTSQAAREAELKRREKEAERAGRQQARAVPHGGAASGWRRRSGRARGGRRGGGARGAPAGGGGDPASSGERLEEQPRRAGRPSGRTAPRRDRRRRAGAARTGGRARCSSSGPTASVVVGSGAMRMVVDADGAHAAARGRAAQGAPVAARAGRGAAARRAVARGRSPRHDRRRGGAGHRRRGRRRGARRAAVPADHPRQGHRRRAGAGPPGRVASDRRVARFGFAPRNQGGTGVTIVEFSA